MTDRNTRVHDRQDFQGQQVQGTHVCCADSCQYISCLGLMFPSGSEVTGCWRVIGILGPHGCNQYPGVFCGLKQTWTCVSVMWHFPAQHCYCRVIEVREGVCCASAW